MICNACSSNTNYQNHHVSIIFFFIIQRCIHATQQDTHVQEQYYQLWQFFFNVEKKKRKIQLYGSKHTLMAVVTALPTSPGPACNVPNPTEGILAPVFNSKIRISFAIFSQNTLLTLARSATIYSQSQAKIT